MDRGTSTELAAPASSADPVAPAGDSARTLDAARSEPDAGNSRGLLLVLAFAALIGLRILSLSAALPDGQSRGAPAFRSDAHRYHQIASEPGVPYRDFEVEYPPATVAMIELINGDDTRSTLRRLGVAAFALDIIVLAGVGYAWGKRAALAYLVLGSPFLFLPFPYFRIDLLSVALAIWGLALVKRKNDVGGGLLLALGVFAKLWPLAVLPLLLVERRLRAIVTVVVVGAVGAVGWFVVGGTGGFEQVLTFRGARGLQIESVAGGVTRLFTGAVPHRISGALRTGDTPFLVTILLAGLMVGGVAFVWWQVYRHGHTDEGVLYGVAPLTAVTIFMVCSPLLSPQFLIWLVPFGAIVWVGGERVLGWLVGLSVVVTMVLTQVYGSLHDAQPVGQGVLALRNALLMAIVVVGIVRVSRSPAPAEAVVDAHS